MRTAHFDCFSGASGDMILGALIDAGVDAEAIRRGLDSFGLPLQMEVEAIRKGGFRATQVSITAADEETHRYLPDVEAILERGALSERQRALALRIFRRLAEAEAAAHGMPLDKVHFHEVGALDSIADIAGCAIGIDLLGVETITCRPIPTGSGTVKCAHGLMPVPAPGTAELLKGVPLAATSIKGELTTPTGAAILTSVVTAWVDAPVMTVERIGHGAGRRELVEQPNILRLFVGQAAETRRQPADAGFEADQVWVLETNLDDLPAEWIGYCCERLLEAGALDVFTTPIMMKKNRPGVLLSVLAAEEKLAEVEDILFRETTTFGVRRYRMDRHKLARRAVTVDTPWGPVAGKLGWREGRPAVLAPEYEACARIAREQQIPLREVYRRVQEAFEAGKLPG